MSHGAVAVFCHMAVLISATGSAHSASSTQISLKVPTTLTDRILASNRPKATGSFTEPELQYARRTAGETYEFRFETRIATSRYRRSSAIDRDTLAARFEGGPRFGRYAVIVDWRPTYKYKLNGGSESFEQHETGLKFKGRFDLGAQNSVIRYSVRASYANADPDDFSRAKVTAEARLTQTHSQNLKTTWQALGFVSKFDRFYGEDRTDLRLTLRATPRLTLKNGISVALSFRLGANASTLSNKSGFDAQIRPEIRFQRR